MQVLNNSSHKYICKIVGLVVALGLSNQSFAATATGELTVTATVTAACSIGNATLAFGEYFPLTTHATADLDSSISVSVACTTGTAANIYSSTLPAERKMVANGSDTLAYQLYTDAGRGTELGTAADVGAISVTGTGEAQNINIYGRINKALKPAPGSYTQVANLTISYE
ncbi:Csu type fimbrial protein [Acinetobacter sp. Lyrl_1]|uniref:Csu type fimbrial protein n=1 Tax=Acinetobacter sp. Lyrl_1 TaxID=3110920 RepID=UPI003F7C295D